MTLVEKIETAITEAINGYKTSYISAEDVNGNLLNIRVADHEANPQRMGEYDISLVVLIDRGTEKDDDDITSIDISKKSFRSIANQYFLNDSGDFIENFESIEKMLDWHDIEY